MVNAQPHSNGDTPETFKAIGRELHGAVAPLQAALARVRAECMHGRNYQHLPATGNPLLNGKRDADLAKVNHLLEACLIAEQLGIELFGKGEKAHE